MVKFYPVAVLFLSALHPLAASASELKVLDCAGNLRASTEIAEGQSKAVKFKLNAQDNFSAAKLSKVDSDSILESRANDSNLKFESVQSGEWKLCKDSGQELAFESVEFIDGMGENLRTASLVAGGAAILSGIAIAADDSDNDSSTTSIIETSDGPDRAVNEVTVDTKRPQNEIIVDSRCNKVGNKPSTLAAKKKGACREGEEAPVISPYD